MGFRFRKQIKIAPGLKLNVTKKGLSSFSLGKKGASINVSGKSVSNTIGIPGTGLSYKTDKSTGSFLGVLVFVAICLVLLYGLFG